VNRPVPDIASLSSSQVRSLLSFGLAHSSADNESGCLEMLRNVLKSGDREAVAALLSDLRSPVPTSEAGPLGFHRLTGARARVVAELAGKSFLDACMSRETSAPALHSLAEYGELLTQPGFPDATQLTGTVIRVLANCSLNAYHGDATSKSTDIQSLTAAIQAMSGSDAMPSDLREYASATCDKLIILAGKDRLTM
jgi:hypothetical protein